MTADSFYKRKRLLIFSLIFLAAAAIEFVLIITLWQKDESIPVTRVENTTIKQPSSSPLHYEMLVSGNELLTTRLNAIQQLDKQYADLITITTDKKRLDSVSKLINVQENNLNRTIDSLSVNPPRQTDSGLNTLFTNIVSSYRSILQNRASVSSLRNAVNLRKNDLNPDEMAMLKTQNDLEEKDNRIAFLESELKALAAKKIAAVPRANAGESESLASLKETLTERENRLASLTTITGNLKQENDKLLKQLNDATKATNPGELAFKNKAASLQQRIDELNAELRLAQVDCNLSRVDAGQIISNSRQRKELLSEASGILTSLAKSDDADIRKKVQDKIIRLNQVAANSRD